MWTDERIERLKALHADGATSGEIAAELGGVTRNAVCGKLHRLGLMGTHAPGAVRPKRVRKKQARQRPYSPKTSGGEDAAPIFAEPLPAYTGTPLSILECSDLRCRYPVRDEPFGACGAPVKPGKPYCAHHAARCFIPLDDRKKRISRLAALVDAEHAAKRMGVW